MVKIAPSLLSADFANLEQEIRKVEQAGVEMLHVDVMDGHFVPNITIGPLVVEAIRRITDLFLDVHLMIDNPIQFFPAFARAGADRIYYHIEISREFDKMADLIQAEGCHAGISINPDTEIDSIINKFDIFSSILIMSVHPGFGGQEFIPETLPKIAQLRQTLGTSIDIAVDGGINVTTIRKVIDAGANIIVAGSAIFGARNPAKAIYDLQNA